MSLIFTDDYRVFLQGDITISENHELTATVSTHPVETGSNPSDHSRPEPRVFTFEIYVTMTPITPAAIPNSLNTRGFTGPVQFNIPQYSPPVEFTPGAATAQLTQALNGTIGPRVEIQALTFGNYFDPVKEMQDALEQLLLDAELVNIETRTRIYENMLIVGVSMPWTEAGGAAFTVSAQQIKIVNTQTVVAPQPKEPRGSPSQKKGSQSTDDAKNPGDLRSIAQQIRKGDINVSKLFGQAFGGGQ